MTLTVDAVVYLRSIDLVKALVNVRDYPQRCLPDRPDLAAHRRSPRPALCFDKAMAESFFGVLKNEHVSRVTYLNREAARQNITDVFSAVIITRLR